MLSNILPSVDVFLSSDLNSHPLGICSFYVVVSTSDTFVQVSRTKLQFKLDQLRAGKTFQELDDEDITAVCAHSLKS